MKNIIASIAFISICYMALADGGYRYNNRVQKNSIIDSTTSLIQQIDFGSFRGKPVDSFLVKIPQNYSSIEKLHTRAATPHGFVITYPNGNYIYVYIKYPLCCVSNPHALPSKWSIGELKMEKADDITLYDAAGCVKGCYPDKEYN